jgi:beta-glucanase (GH16 family)
MGNIFYRFQFVVLFCLITNSFSAGGWKLFWSDEFDSTALNTQNWMIRVANRGWVNNEEQRYTDGHDQASSNIFVKNGCLILEARKSASGEITSGRIEGMGKKSFQYGRMESRLRMPKSQGYWPAFWMLGVNGGWPSCGECDIMEGKGAQPRWTQGAFHSSQGMNIANKGYTVPTTQGDLHDSFHIHAIEWSADSIRWYCDNVNFLTLLRAQHAGIPINTWAYYFILNCAVGGGFGGASNSTTIFPESLVVDYVRVYHWDQNVKQETALPQHQTVRPAFVNSGSAYSVVLPSLQSYSFELVSVTGRKTVVQNGIGRTFRIKTDGLSPGVYFASVQGAFGKHSDRIVIRDR